MKNLAIKLVWFTTLFLFVFASLSQTNMAAPVIMSLFIIGQFLILFMVYIVLIDTYSTKKTFKDWYEDHTMNTLDKEQ